MTKEEQKAFNAENYPASVLTWLNEATDRAYEEFESRTCNNCKKSEDFCFYLSLVHTYNRINTFGCNDFIKKEAKDK